MEQGLKQQIIRQRTFKEHAQQNLCTLLHENTKLALAGVLKEEHVWPIVLKLGLWREGIQSSSVGVFTTIKDYTNKKGKTFKAHFSENGYFLEKCKSENEQPRSYEGNFPITKERFRFQLNPDAKMLQHFFVGRSGDPPVPAPIRQQNNDFLKAFRVEHDSLPSPSSSESDDEEAPLSAVAKKITIRLKKGAAARK